MQQSTCALFTKKEKNIRIRICIYQKFISGVSFYLELMNIVSIEKVSFIASNSVNIYIEIII